MLIHGIEIPKALQITGKKPWEILHQDTMDLWKFGDYKSYTSLDLLAAARVIEVVVPEDEVLDLHGVEIELLDRREV